MEKETFKTLLKDKPEPFWEYMKIVYSLCAEHNIFIKRWRMEESGVAYMAKNEIVIPPPVSAHNMMICLHEIGHIVTTKSTMRTVRSEYHACLYSEQKCAEYKIPLVEDDFQSNRMYVISHICKGLQKGKMSVGAIDPIIANYCKINKTEWSESVNKGIFPYIATTDRGSRWEQCDLVWHGLIKK